MTKAYWKRKAELWKARSERDKQWHMAHADGKTLVVNMQCPYCGHIGSAGMHMLGLPAHGTVDCPECDKQLRYWVGAICYTESGWLESFDAVVKENGEISYIPKEGTHYP